MTKLTWVAVRGPGVDRLSMWTGKTKKLLVTGLTREFVGNAPTSFELPEGAEINEMPCDKDGYVFTVFDKETV